MTRRVITSLLVVVLIATIVGCGASKTSEVPPVQVTVLPATATVPAGATKQFGASVINTPNAAVTWTVEGGSGNGTIGSSGLYTAPATVPNPATVTIKATSQADTTKSATATVTVTAPVAVSITPTTANVEAGATEQFTANVTGTDNANVTWSVVGGDANGTISGTGLYTAPATVPNPATVTIKAVSQADTTKSATATVTVINAAVSVAMTPNSASVIVSRTQQFAATVANAKDQTVTWAVNGTVGGDATIGTISTTGLYTAPSVVPTPATVTITATSNADTTKSATAQVTITEVPAITVGVTPKTATLAVGASQQFTASVANATDSSVVWKVNDIAGGDATVGTITDKGLYTAPASVPTIGPQVARRISETRTANVVTTADVTVTAVSVEDPSKYDSATVTITPPPPVTIAVSPKTADVPVKGTQQFSANVTGTNDTAVDWSIDGCDATCGTIDSTGKYTAPDAVPASTVTIKATLHADTTKYDTATVTVKAVSANASKLNGKYAFVFSGYKVSAEITRIGNFTADGTGNISGGTVISQTAGQSRTSVAITGGSYTIGDDNRGELTLTTGSSSIKYRFVLRADGNGRFIEFDGTNALSPHGAGEFKKEDVAALSQLAKGNYVLAAVGSLNGQNRLGMLVQFSADWSVQSTTGEVDYVFASDYSRHGSATVATQSPNGDYLLMTVTPQGSTAETFDVYLSSPDEGYVVINNSGQTELPYMVGRIARQTNAGSFANTSLNGPLVFQLGGYDLDPGDRTKTAVGQVVMDGKGGFTGFIDQNDINDPQPYQTYTMHGDYTVSANGRAQGNFYVGPSPTPVPLIFYLYAPNKGFLMDGVRTTAIVKDVNVGTLEPQSAGPFSVPSGTFTVSWIDMITKDVRLPVGTMTFATNGSGNFNATLDLDDGTLYPDQSITGKYTVTNSTSGRGTMSVTLPDRTLPMVLYSVSPSKAYGVSMDPDDGNSVVMTFER
jgi:hypothetical protein